MPSEQRVTIVSDTEQQLPFLLRLIVGSEEKGDIIPLRRLCQFSQSISDCIYEVQELKPLRLQIQYEQTVPVTFVWNKVYEGRKDNTEWSYHLHERQQTVLLYEHGKTDYVYPWRCGLYHFEVNVQGSIYYGAFRITPKNFQDEGLALIQQTVERVMGSLIMDRGHYKKTFSSFADLEDHPQMAAIRMLSKQAGRMQELYAEILRSEFREAVYETGRQYKRQDSHAARKNMKLEERGAGVRYNRYYREASDRLRYIQQRTRSFLYRLQQFIHFVEDTIMKLESLQESSKAEKQAVQGILQAVERNGSVTERDKQKYRNILPLKDTDVKRSTVKMREYKVMKSVLEDLFVGMLALSELRETEDTVTHTPTALRPKEREYIRLLEVCERKAKDPAPDPLFLLVQKPTFLLYEYYMYFAVIEALQELGFRAVPAVMEQIQRYFYLDGLQDGTIVILEKGQCVLHVAFNDLIETHPLIALSKGSHFYNGEDTKKPDIRLDWYQKEQGAEVYQSSIIIEVKYSPMYNIFQSIGNTKATEQMYKYWSIKYVYEQDGKRHFCRRAIHEVICVYPGSQVHAKKIEAGCGIFLQFYPYRSKRGQEQVMGKRELLRLVGDWLSWPE